MAVPFFPHNGGHQSQHPVGSEFQSHVGDFLHYFLACPAAIQQGLALVTQFQQGETHDQGKEDDLEQILFGQ